MRHISVFGNEIDLKSVGVVGQPIIERYSGSHYSNVYSFEITFTSGGSKKLSLPFTPDKDIMQKWDEGDYPINEYEFINFLNEFQLPRYNDQYFKPFVKAWKEL